MNSPIRRGVVDSGPLHCLGGWPPPLLALTHFHWWLQCHIVWTREACLHSLVFGCGASKVRAFPYFLDFIPNLLRCFNQEAGVHNTLNHFNVPSPLLDLRLCFLAHHCINGRLQQLSKIMTSQIIDGKPSSCHTSHNFRLRDGLHNQEVLLPNNQLLFGLHLPLLSSSLDPTCHLLLLSMYLVSLFYFSIWSSQSSFILLY